MSDLVDAMESLVRDRSWSCTTTRLSLVVPIPESWWELSDRHTIPITNIENPWGILKFELGEDIIINGVIEGDDELRFGYRDWFLNLPWKVPMLLLWLNGSYNWSQWRANSLLLLFARCWRYQCYPSCAPCLLGKMKCCALKWNDCKVNQLCVSTFAFFIRCHIPLNHVILT